MATRHINWILILKAWAMLWVVIGHATMCDIEELATAPVYENLFYRFAYSFHMALFMFVAGYLFYMTRIVPADRHWTYLAMARNKVKRLIIPCVVFSLIAFALKFAFPGAVERQVSLQWRDVLHMVIYPVDNPLREMWFIITLMWLFLLMPLWHWAVRRPARLAATVIALAVINMLDPQVDLLCIGNVCTHAVWFFMGIVACRYGDALFDLKRRMRGHSTTIFIAGIAAYAFGWWHEVPFIITFGGIVLSIGLALAADKYLPWLFRSFRDYTYQIFLMGIFVQMAVKVVYLRLGIPHPAAYLMSILLGLYIPVLVSKAIERTGWRPLHIATGLRAAKTQ